MQLVEKGRKEGIEWEVELTIYENIKVTSLWVTLSAVCQSLETLTHVHSAIMSTAVRLEKAAKAVMEGDN